MATKKTVKHVVAEPEFIPVLLTAALAFDGKIVTAGSIIDLTEKEAKDVLARGKGVLYTEDEATTEDEGAAETKADDKAEE